MAPKESLRRSRRAQVPKKYTVDAFAGLKDILIESSGEESDSQPVSVQEDSDEEFNQEAVANAEEDDDDDQEDAELEAADSENENIEEYEIADDESVIDTTATATHQHKPKSRTVVPPATRNETHSMGIAGFHARYSREDRVVGHFGTGEEDVIAHVRFRDLWRNTPYFPARSAVSRSPFYPAKKRSKEATEGFQWYYDLGGRELFQQTQIIHEQSVEDMQSILPNCPNAFIAGSYNDPNLFRLEALQSVSLVDALAKPNSKSSGTGRSGWILNLGARAQCLEWVPNRNNISQILMASANSSTSRDNPIGRDENDEEFQSAFKPGPQRLSGLYLWEFPANRSKLDFQQDPRLRAVISYDWNDARQLKWCPAPVRDDDLEDADQTRLGLLAGVWADGLVRVIDVVLPNQESTVYLHISKASFESKPPDTICTGVTWLSTSAIAAGCANGNVAVWDLPSSLGLSSENKLTTAPQANPRPWLYKSFHESYITNITCGYPSRPYALFTNCIDGQMRLTDLRDPSNDSVFAKRVRTPQVAFAWHDGSQQLLKSDENGDLLSHYLRLFHAKEFAIRWNALITDIATSELHSIILMGCADGLVGTINVAKRMGNLKIMPPTRQIWFQYEWRGAVRKEWDVPIENSSENSEPPVDLETFNNPLGRFTDGYKAERVNLNNLSRPNFKEGTSYSTIYELPTAISRVSWNPNVSFGTWAAAATGSGLIRVEDLGID
jgi:transcription factor C subunit 6